ncbi:MAG: hypothetical protein M1827_003993 [Pycnora praestabilis]|nr:MAG: hypothetical protein M1827_003993 [Pycnora praestabilis]
MPWKLTEPLLQSKQAAFISHLLTLFSLLNASYTFSRNRHYRLFETSIDLPPSTPSAHRVHVDSSPLSSSPLRFLSNMIAASAAESRSHPDATRDVWELAVWDPLPLCLRLFCLFSPGHVLVYWLFLPTAPQDPRPSTTVVTTITLGALLSTQLLFLQSSFSQQTKDTAVIHKEVLHEYDTKYVHPRLNPQVRDVGTQYSDASTSTHWSHGHSYDQKHNKVDTYTPTTMINHGFRTNPNPNYAKYTDSDGIGQYTQGRGMASATRPGFQTPLPADDASSPVRHRTAIKQPQFRPSTVGGDGGSLGVYSHANSPLKRSASTHFRAPLGDDDKGFPRSLTMRGFGDERDRSRSPTKREGSPLKRSSVPAGLNALANGQRYGHLHSEAPVRRESGRF